MEKEHKWKTIQRHKFENSDIEQRTDQCEQCELMRFTIGDRVMTYCTSTNLGFIKIKPECSLLRLKNKEIERTLHEIHGAGALNNPIFGEIPRG